MFSGTTPSHFRPRVIAYAIILIALGSWTCFHRLGEGMLIADEASFAYTTDHMLQTGDWIVPYIHARNPHLNAAPLYNWLTNLTAPLFGDGNLKYRVWSAVFGIGCALAALALGTLLFRPEVGFLAGLLLLTNVYFLVMHGARCCVMEAGLAFCVTTMVACYVKANSTLTQPRLWWALTGLCLGLAVLMKPPAMGGFFFVSLCGYHLVARRDLPWKTRLAGPMVAGCLAFLVALPWYAMIYARLGMDGLDHLFLTNSVRRAADAGRGNTQPMGFYAEHIWSSSLGFRFVLPGLVFGVVCILVGWNRRAWGVLVVPTGAFVLAISCSATKHHHYAFPAYPLLSVAAAALLLAGLTPPRTPERVRTKWFWRSVAILGVAVATNALWADFRQVAWQVRAERWDYPAVRFHRALETELVAGDARLVLYAFPGDRDTLDRKLGVAAHDMYYPATLPHALRVTTIADLNRTLADGKPTVVILPPLLTSERLLKAGLTAIPERSLMVRSDLFPYPVLLFHGAETKLGLTELLGKLELAAGEPAIRP